MLVACIRVSMTSIHTCCIRVGEESATLCQVVRIYSRFTRVGISGKEALNILRCVVNYESILSGRQKLARYRWWASQFVRGTSELHDKWMLFPLPFFFIYLATLENEIKLNYSSSFSLPLSNEKQVPIMKDMKLSPSFVNITIRKSLPTCSVRTNSFLMLSHLKYALLMILMGCREPF